MCAGCQKPLGTGRFLSCMGSQWHPRCFRCTACDEPITDYEVLAHRPFFGFCFWSWMTVSNGRTDFLARSRPEVRLGQKLGHVWCVVVEREESFFSHLSGLLAVPSTVIWFILSLQMWFGILISWYLDERSDSSNVDFLDLILSHGLWNSLYRDHRSAGLDWGLYISFRRLCGRWGKLPWEL